MSLYTVRRVYPHLRAFLSFYLTTLLGLSHRKDANSNSQKLKHLDVLLEQTRYIVHEDKREDENDSSDEDEESGCIKYDDNCAQELTSYTTSLMDLIPYIEEPQNPENT